MQFEPGGDQFDALEIIHGAAIRGIAADDAACQFRIVGIEQDDMREIARAHRVKTLLPVGVGSFAVDSDENGQCRRGFRAFAARIGIDRYQPGHGRQRRTLAFAQVEEQQAWRLTFRHGFIPVV